MDRKPVVVIIDSNQAVRELLEYFCQDKGFETITEDPKRFQRGEVDPNEILSDADSVFYSIEPYYFGNTKYFLIIF